MAKLIRRGFVPPIYIGGTSPPRNIVRCRTIPPRNYSVSELLTLTLTPFRRGTLTLICQRWTQSATKSANFYCSESDLFRGGIVPPTFFGGTIPPTRGVWLADKILADCTRVDGGSDQTQADFSADPPESAKKNVLAESAVDKVRWF